MQCRIRQFFSWLLLLGAIVLGVLLGLGMFPPDEAIAAIRQLEEAPGQVVYQSRQTLKDQYGNSWQTIAFKRIRPHENTSVELRLVGFPGVVEIDHTQPLTLTNSLGSTQFAVDTSNDIFSDRDRPEPNIGQYSLQPILSQLQAEIPLELTLPTIKSEAVRLSVPPALLQEWQTLAEQESAPRNPLPS